MISSTSAENVDVPEYARRENSREINDSRNTIHVFKTGSDFQK